MATNTLSACVDNATETKIRAAVGNMLDKDVRLVKLYFRPSESYTGFLRPLLHFLSTKFRAEPASTSHCSP
jgi:hypothetical protein